MKYKKRTDDPLTRKGTQFMLVTRDEVELPVLIGTRWQIAHFLKKDIKDVEQCIWNSTPVSTDYLVIKIPQESEDDSNE